MGYSLSWAAVKSTPEAVQSALGLRATGQREEFPESRIVATSLPNGWYIVIYNKCEAARKALEPLSRLGEVIYCSVEEHVMVSAAATWNSGKRLWFVEHDAQQGIYNLQVAGQPPDAFGVIRDREKGKQDAEGGENADVDYMFDIPVELARELTGFRHDQSVPGIEGDAYEVLEAAKQSKRWGLF
jgi:hypothetical protein